ncbi:OLC1v1009187C1 [Oldenlandia corymbosa var. corymbosa]|nr:OLC1v1009187C1 [Oldenlandia corymbosa var. corymbosa]
MLRNITGLPADAFNGKSRKNDFIISEAYPESEFNPSRDVLEGDGRISIEDLLDPLRETSNYSKLRRDVARMERKPSSLLPPLPKPDQQKVERAVAYQDTKRHITNWEPVVKRNREAPTIYFDEDTDIGFSTVGAIASEFEPRSDFERKMASLLNHNEIVEAHKNDGAKLLELNKISVDEVRDQQNRLAKLRSLLFRHEMKSKRIRKIKSKTYHRMLKRDKLKATASAMEMDPDAAKELAMKQEFKRAEERMRLIHKNNSKWAKRIMKRGLDVQDEGTRAAISEQLHQHAILTRKMNSLKDSSDESSDEDESDIDFGPDDPAALLKKAKEKTLEAMEEDEELPISGVASLPFMVRSLKKRKEEADREARAALEDYDRSLKQLEDKDEEQNTNPDVVSGKRAFGPTKKQIKKVQDSSDKMRSDNFYGHSDSEDSLEGVEDEQNQSYNESFEDINIDHNILRNESEIGHDALFKSFEDIVKNPGPKTTHEVAIFASNSWQKKKNLPEGSNQQTGAQDGKLSDSPKNSMSHLHSQDMEGDDIDSDSGSEGQMVDGILSSGPRSTYELPSQEELIRRAFASDDVEEEFEKDKEEVLNEENPEPEKPSLLPGWGQWTHIQEKKGIPSWMLKEHEIEKKKREEEVKKRKDADLKHVIISEKLDKKAEKLYTKTLPFPFTSKEVFEQSIRMPIGPEFNPATAVGALIRPEVVKKPGVIIKPIKHKDINPHERSEDKGKRKHKPQKSKTKTNSTISGKSKVTF